MSTLAIELCERGWLPDWLTRLGMRRLLAQRISDESADNGEQEFSRYQALLTELRQSRIAVETAAANEQHYELPAAFFEQVLGANLKYSSCWWGEGVTDLDQAEALMLQLTCERAQLADGQKILELGCGWGSLTVWMGRHYPQARITAVSNSGCSGGSIKVENAAGGNGAPPIRTQPCAIVCAGVR